MIYRALVALAQHEGLLQDTAYEPKEVDYLIHLGEGGRYLSYQAPRLPQALDRKGRPKGRPRPPKRPIPRRSDRTAQDRAEFLVDKAEYVLGVDPAAPVQFKTAEEREAHEGRARARRTLFLQAVAVAGQALPKTPALAAVASFLASEVPEELRSLLRAGSAADRQQMAGAVFAFVYDPDGGVACVHDHPDVKAYFGGLQDAEGGERGQCLVTGETNVALTRLHAKPKGIPPLSKTKGGVPLTAVNEDAFVSYGLKTIGCAPIGRGANVAVELALNRLLDPAYPRPDGSPFPKRHEVISPDTVLVYWARDDALLDFIHDFEAADPETVGAMLRNPAGGRPAPLQDPSAFYALMLSGGQGRAVVRSLVETTVRDIAANVDRFREEAAIVRPYEDSPGGYPLTTLRRALVPRGDLERLAGAFATDLYLSVLTGSPFKGALVETIVRRNRADLFPSARGTARQDPVPLAARCSLLKAYFTRNRKETTSVALDEARTDPPYLLGRLLAAIDRIQQDALGNLNATVVDRFFGSASSTPRSVFPTLIRRSQHHLAKLRREKPGASVNRERLLEQILSGLDAFPATLGLEDQARFALGFYHQRQSFFSKN